MSPRHILAKPVLHSAMPLHFHARAQWRAKVYRIVHHPVTRIALFLTAVIISVWMADRLAHSALLTTGAAASAPALARSCERGIEVLCDVVCDRLFPE